MCAATRLVNALDGLLAPDAIDELRTLLADNTDLVTGLFLTICEWDASNRAPVTRAGIPPIAATRADNAPAAGTSAKTTA